MKDDHRLARTTQRLSPNRDARPDPRDISLVVIHGISLPPGRFGTGMVVDFFLNRLDVNADAALADLAGVRVSAHLFIDRRGRTTQFVPFDERAWHAGVSRWRGREGCNDFSIGIELEGVDDRPYTHAQYARLMAVLEALLDRYPHLSRSAVVGHQEIAPGRKTDPGPAFDWPGVLGHLWKL
ncbi:MAG: 1,6-anhydro-N-acetylmuramyl-L-alanine amidase AmpD [Gammaproteobacteria bacterium]